MKLFFEWIKGKGGLSEIEKINLAKKDLLYNVVDANPDFYTGTAEKDSRSWMNITLRLPTQDLESRFINEAKENCIVGIKGHRSFGGLRFSIYNAMTIEGVHETVEFMERFRKSV